MSRSRRAPWRERQAHWLVLVGSLLLTFAATAFVTASIQARDQGRFGNAMQSASDRVQTRFDIYAATLRGAAALFASEETVDSAEFHRYVERLELQRWYPGIQGIGWSERVASNIPGELDEEYSIRFLQPLDDRNLAALGYDMYSESVRRDAKRQARDGGEPALSGPVTLVQEISGPKQAGFLLYVPVYEGGVIPATVEERRERLVGFAYSPFRAHDLFAGIFGSEEQPRVSIEVYDGGTVDTSAHLATLGKVEGHKSEWTGTRQVAIAGRTWTLRFASRPEFESASSRGLIPMVLLAGLLASSWLFFLARGQTRARAVAEEANQAKSTFLAKMSHELRTPLNAIGGYVELMQLGIGGSLTQTQLDYLKRMHRAQRHLLNLINDVLNFARIDAGGVEYRLQPHSVQAVVDDVLTLVSLQAEQRNVALTVVGGPDVPVLADGEKLRQIFLNLLTNAIKFTAPGGEVAVRWRSSDERVDVDVQDNGIGIPADRLDAIFEPFLQLDTNLAQPTHGTGLGLAISRELARGMNGDLRVHSVVDEGSIFTLRLPAASAAEAAA